jgi:hypothetical protein
MTCREVDNYHSGSGGSAVLSPHLEQHLAECPGCRALSGVLANCLSVGAVSPAVVHRVETKLLADLKPVRPLASGRFFMIAFVAIFAALVATGVNRLGAYGWADLDIVRRILMFLSLGASTALLSFSLVRQMVPGSVHRVPPSILPAAVFTFLLLVMAGTFRFVREPHFMEAGLRCLGAGIPYGIPAAIVFWLIIRRGTVLSPRLTGATAGALAGLVGMTVLELHCPNFDMLHIITFHLGIVVIGTMAGLVLGFCGEFLGRRAKSR